MKRIARLTFSLGLLAAVVAGSLAGASTAAIASPTGLHGFMLSATAPAGTTFHQTPSFAWNPSGGAVRYELQISQSPTFQENGMLFDGKSFLTPVAAPDLTLPWITGNPHSLYARVRAILVGGGTSPWSADYGFDVVPPAPPTSISSYNGLLRWAPVQGATGYDVWLLDAHKIEGVNTNVFDEREFFGASFVSNVRWRVRATRLDVVPRLNGMPVSTHGAWSLIYTATAALPTATPIQLVGTVSESFSGGSAGAPAHKLMPGFVWTGNEDPLTGTSASLFRVEVFTDSSCLNRVWTGAVVGSPAYAPRLYGSKDGTAVGPNFTADGDPLTPNEDGAAAIPTTTVHGTKDKIDVLNPDALGAALDLWDQNWPSSGYYWTVMPVVQVDGGYVDTELPQDMCGAGFVQRFGISSEPALTAGSGTPFASGLSASGHLVSGGHAAKFYGEPLVAWTPAVNATAYELQWSKQAYPFRAVGTHLTLATSLVLNLKPGTWYYRVRGFDYNLPTGSQEMAWSQPVKIVVAAPQFYMLSGSRR
jgi:hypothetical protein